MLINTEFFSKCVISGSAYNLFTERGTEIIHYYILKGY